MRITRLLLRNVGRRGESELSFPAGTDPKKADAYLFVGQNGAGKSTALAALAQFFAPYSTGLRARLVGPTPLVALETDEGVAAVGLDYASPPSLMFREPPRPVELRDRWPEADVVFWRPPSPFAGLDEKLKSYRARSQAGAREALGEFEWAAFAYGPARNLGSVAIPGVVEQQGSPFRFALGFGRAADSLDFVQWVANNYFKSLSARQRGEAEKADERAAATRVIEEVVVALTGAPFEFVVDDDPIGVRARFDGALIGLDVLPDGLKSILSWVADLVMRLDRIPWADPNVPLVRRPFFLFLDEVELHLHPQWQRKLLPVVQSRFPEAQVFAATHSPFVVASAADAFIYQFERGVVTGPIPANDGLSVMAVLRDVFGVKEEFSVSIEAQLDRLEDGCAAVLRGDVTRRPEVEALAAELSKRGPELAAIVGHQLRQLDRQLSRAQSA